ncbi:ArsR/SmtB family transcription factor [Streptosporangium sp. V21-05]|uniref:ArsR/SmtB family transcription factor n=1 Tax=Streptosporangium sp. V21-05 TaxID=3446115 RepID=UPI003F537BF2
MQVFEALGDPVRRRIVELLAGGEQGAGAVSGVVRAEFGISRPAVSRHLRVLRDSGLVTVRADGARRLYAVEPAPLREVDIWLERFRRFWSRRLDALGTELTRGGHEHRDLSLALGPGLDRDLSRDRDRDLGRDRDLVLDRGRDRDRDRRENTARVPPVDTHPSTRNEEDT